MQTVKVIKQYFANKKIGISESATSLGLNIIVNGGREGIGEGCIPDRRQCANINKFKKCIVEKTKKL